MSDLIERQRKLVAQFPGNEMARFSLGKALFDAGRFDEALEHLEFALAKRPDWMVVQILIGHCARAKGDLARARECFLRARQLAIEQNHEGPREEMEKLLAEIPG